MAAGIKGIYIGVISQDEKGNRVVEINNLGGVTPAKKVLFRHNQEVRLALILEMGQGKYFWKNETYKGKEFTIRQLPEKPKEIPAAPNQPNNLYLDTTDKMKITWWKITPRLQHQNDQCNDPYRQDNKYYTNVYADSYDSRGNLVETGSSETRYQEGTYLGQQGNFGKIKGSSGLDIIEYQFEKLHDKSKVWEITAGTNPGVFRYAAAVYFKDAEKKEIEIATPGRPSGATDANSVEGISGLKAVDYSCGISPKVTRIIRRHNHADDYLSVIKAFENVPWIYGSCDKFMGQSHTDTHQAECLVGFDCADLIVSAARLAGRTGCGYVGAHDLAMAAKDRNGLKTTAWSYNRALYLEKVYKKETLEIIYQIKDKITKQIVSFKFGKNIFEGDLILFDWDENNVFTHTTVIYSNNGNDFLCEKAQLIAAHWMPNQSIEIKTLEDFASTPNIYFRVSKWLKK